ncbi:MAG: hypothetical protein M1840_002252 [Geoglossum simile]|nr:MAG: hypothetical protein M1840_002252 [Geoglossum simile]
MSDTEIIIGIDFGTTFSGVGWTFTGQRKPDIISTPGAPWGSVRTPTEILYNGHSSGEPRWGWNARGKEGALKYFKLELDEEQRAKIPQLFEFEDPATPQNLGDSFFSPFKQPRHRRSTTITLQQPPGETDICADYLKAIGNEAIKAITRSKVVLKTTPVQYVLTVPANWSDAAKNATKKCARDAFGSTAKIALILEPQAAAIHVLKSDAISTLVKGGHYIVCDVGGGTVDLITYQILNDKPLELGESVRGTADVCGALLLNWKFECYLAKILGKYYTGEAGGRAMKKAVQMMREKFETNIKRHFEYTDDSWELDFPYDIPIDERPSIVTQDDIIEISGSSLATDVFDPVVEKILTLIQEQVDRVQRMDRKATIAGIILVGGFGGNKYLAKNVKEGFSGVVNEVLQPLDGWEAVVSGALAWGLDQSTVVRRKIPRYYGQELTLPAKAGRRSFINPVTGQDSCKEMLWYVRAGDYITHNTPPCALRCYGDPAVEKFLEISLLAWDPKPSDEEAPQVRTQDCYEVGKLQLKLDNLNWEIFDKKKRKGRNGHYYCIDFKVRLVFRSDLAFTAILPDGSTKKLHVKY